MSKNESKDWGIGIPSYKESDLMSQEEINEFAMETILDCVKSEYNILFASLNDGGFMYVVAEQGKQKYMIIIKSCIAMDIPEMTIEEKQQILNISRSNNFIPLFAAVSFGSTDSERFAQSIALRGDSYYCRFNGFETIN